MKWLLAIPLSAGLLFPPFASAQFRIAPRSFGPAPAKATRNFISASSKSPIISKAGGAFSIVSPFRVETRSPWTQPAPRAGWGRRFGERRSGGSEFLFFNSPPFGYPFSYPNAYDAPLFYPTLWPPLDQQYLQAWQIAHGDVAGEIASQQKDLLSSQVQSLASEVESLGQGGASQPPAAPQATAQRRSIPTVFVYRDGRSVEVRNYAIFNQTLWVFGAETTRRIPLSAINLPATLKLNEDRGVDVSLPDAQ